MQRAVSDSSVSSGSRLRRFGSAISRRISSKSVNSPSENLPSVQKFVQELDATETVAGPAGSLASGDVVFEQLRDNIRCLHKPSLGPLTVDFAFSVYEKYREPTLALCNALVEKSKSTIFTSSYEATQTTGALETEESNEGFMKDAWLTVIHDFKAYQQLLLETLRISITSVYEVYEPNATVAHEEALLNDKVFRSVAISRMQSTSLPPTAPHAPADWQYESRFQNYDLVKSDLQQTESLCAIARVGKGYGVAIREYDIAKNGDAILEFANTLSNLHPVLRFRVSSHMLTEASPYFANVFNASYSESNALTEHLERLPPRPIKHICKDGTEVKVYRMPQLEFNKWESLTILLYAAHMHNDQVPRQVRFHEFVSIAEVCLRYQCTGPLEMSVEYRWLPEWLHKANEDYPDGFLLISYVFGLRRLFTRTSKSIILNSSSDGEIQRNELWPTEVKDKLRAIREVKLDQIYVACFNTIQEYIRYPSFTLDKSASTFETTPKCPRGLRQCDATNLGWLMLVYSELGIQHAILGENKNLDRLPQRSINDLVGHLRRMPSAPQMHSGMCDYAPAFRSSMDDIYNSIKGLTLKEVSGRAGWALSKRHDTNTHLADDHLQGLFELPATLEQQNLDPAYSADDTITLRILSHLEDVDDLHAAAIVNKAWYAIYKKHELSLMRNLVRVSKLRKLRTSIIDSSLAHEACDDDPHPNIISNLPSTPMPSMSPSIIEQNHLPPLNIPHDNERDMTPPRSPRTPLETLPEIALSHAEVENILWPRTGNDIDPITIRSRLSGMVHNLDPESNAKFLSGDLAHIDKRLVIDESKHLRDEHDKGLRMGPR